MQSSNKQIEISDVGNKIKNQRLQQIQYNIPNGDNDDFLNSHIDYKMNNSSNFIHSEIKQSSRFNTRNSLGDQDILKIDINLINEGITQQYSQNSIGYRQQRNQQQIDKFSSNKNNNFFFNESNQEIQDYNYISKNIIQKCESKNIIENNIHGLYENQDLQTINQQQVQLLEFQNNNSNKSIENAKNSSNFDKLSSISRDEQEEQDQSQIKNNESIIIHNPINNPINYVNLNSKRNSNNINTSTIDNQFSNRNKNKSNFIQLIKSKRDSEIASNSIYDKNASNFDSRFNKTTNFGKQHFNTKVNSNYKTFRQYQTSRLNSEKFYHGLQIIKNQLNGSQTRQNRIDELVIKFIRQLKKTFQKKSQNYLSLLQLQMLNDYVDYSQKLKHKSKFIHYLLIARQKIKKMFHESIFKVFLPTHTFKVVWDTIQIIFHFIFFYSFSIYLFFSQNEIESPFLNKIYGVFILQLIIDIFIVLNSAYYLQDQIITNRVQIFKNYLNSALVFDLLALSSSIYMSMNSENSFVYNPDHSIKLYMINLVIFARIVGVSQKKGGFDLVQSMSTSSRHLLRLINQLLFMISFAHIQKLKQVNILNHFHYQKVAIFWYLLGIFQETHKYDNNWLLKSHITQERWYSKYLYSLYWAVTTMTTVGYGDLTPSNYIEALFNSISMILFSCVFAYSINNVGIILQDIEKGSKELKNNIITMQRYLQRRNVNSELRSRIKNYLYFLASETKERDRSAEEGVIQLLSNKLRDELTFEVNTKMIRLCAIFDKLFSRQTIIKLTYAIQEIQVSPNEIIFSQNDVGNQAIYFILDGQIEIYSEHEKRKTFYKKLSSSQYFGEYSFFSGLSRRASARSINLSTLCLLSRESFLQIIKNNSEDYQRFKQLQEQVSVLGDISVINLGGCFSCGQLDHYSNNCPKTHLQLDKQFVVLKYNYFEFQERQFYQRCKQKSKLTSYALYLIQHNEMYTTKLIHTMEQAGGEYLEKLAYYQNFISDDMKSFMYSQNEGSGSETSFEDGNDQNEPQLSKQKTKRDPIYESMLYQYPFKDNNIEAQLNDESQMKMFQQRQDKCTKSGFTGFIYTQQENQIIRSDRTIMDYQDQQKHNSEYNPNPINYSFNSFSKIEKNFYQDDKLQEEQKKSHKQIPSIIEQLILANNGLSKKPMVYDNNHEYIIDHSKNSNKNSAKVLERKNVQWYNTIDLEKQMMGSPMTQPKDDKGYDNSSFYLESSPQSQIQEIKVQPQNYKDPNSQIKRLNKQTKHRTKTLTTHENDEQNYSQQQEIVKLLAQVFSKCVTKNIETFAEEIQLLAKEKPCQQNENNNKSKSELSKAKKNSNKSSISLKGLSEQEKRESAFSNPLQNNIIQTLMNTRNSITESQNLNEVFIFREIQNFERLFTFSKFFPHNNLSSILNIIKKKKSQSPKSSKKIMMNRRERNFDAVQKHLQDFVLSQQSNFSSNQLSNYAQTYSPTVISYGINTSKCIINPIRFKNNCLF